MRSPEEIKRLVTRIADSDDRIRAVLLNGSRANDKVVPDKYQDFDIVFVVEDIETLVSDTSWTDAFGEKLIWQLPDEMVVGKRDPDRGDRFSLLMLFSDGNRIDLTLLPKKDIDVNYKTDSLTIAWLDKDNIFSKIGWPDDSDYHLHAPTEKEFLDTCNEFWWVSTYVAKGLVRNEILYAKEMLDTVVRPMFMNVIAWHIGIENNFSVSVGKGGKFMKNFLPPDLYKRILQTYSDHAVENNWKALFLMMEIFGQLAGAISDKLRFKYITTEQQNVTEYVRQLYNEQSAPGSR